MSTERPTRADVEAWRGNVQESRKPVNWGYYVDLANAYLALLDSHERLRARLDAAEQRWDRMKFNTQLNAPQWYEAMLAVEKAIQPKSKG